MCLGLRERVHIVYGIARGCPAGAIAVPDVVDNPYAPPDCRGNGIDGKLFEIPVKEEGYFLITPLEEHAP